jgi:N-acetylglucosamine kinase-like BadF-type ATPase
MILIVDSGSTKCDWIAVNASGEQVHDKVRTGGLNPAILDREALFDTILKSEFLKTQALEVSHVYFYGAGCGTPIPKQQLKDVLETIFNKAQVEVEEDTMAAVRATIDYSDEKAIVCILGTGSNCSYFDGKNIHQRVVSLGYTLMDEASGNFFGKELIKDYYFNVMPNDLKLKFEDQFNLDADTIKYNLYKKENPNAYLASFAEFMIENLDTPYAKSLAERGLKLFSKNMILQFKDEINSGTKVHFAGSIAYFIQEEIKLIAKNLGFKTGNFVRRPIEGLVNYHIKN